MLFFCSDVILMGKQGWLMYSFNVEWKWKHRIEPGWGWEAKMPLLLYIISCFGISVNITTGGEHTRHAQPNEPIRSKSFGNKCLHWLKYSKPNWAHHRFPLGVIALSMASTAITTTPPLIWSPPSYMNLICYLINILFWNNRSGKQKTCFPKLIAERLDWFKFSLTVI